MTFIHEARAQTMFRDIKRLREAIRGHDSFAAEAALERCERWFDQLDVVSKWDAGSNSRLDNP